MNWSPRCQRPRKMDKEAQRRRKDTPRKRRKSCTGCGSSWRLSKPSITCIWICLVMYKPDLGQRKYWRKLIVKREQIYPARTFSIFQSTWEWWKMKWKWRNLSLWRLLWKSRHSSFSLRICIRISAFANRESKVEITIASLKMRFRSFNRAYATWFATMIKKSLITSNSQKSHSSSFAVDKMSRSISYTWPLRIQCHLSFNLWWTSTSANSA